MSDLPQKCFYQDGDYTSPVLIWTSPKRYPLAADGDVTTYEYTRRYLVAWESWVPTQLGTVDPLDSTAFLVREEPPAGGRNPLSEFERVYCRVPSRITKASSVMFSPPNPPVETGAWNSLYFTATNGATNVYYMRTCTDSGFASAPSGGTYTLTLNGQTTSALAHNASAATIQTALRALSSATNWGTGLTVTGSALGIADGPTVQLALNMSVQFSFVAGGNLSVTPTQTFVSALKESGFTVAQAWNLFYGLNGLIPLKDGTFTVSFMGETTAAINMSASQADIQSAVGALPKLSAFGAISVEDVRYENLTGTKKTLWMGTTPTFSNLPAGVVLTLSSTSDTPDFITWSFSRSGTDFALNDTFTVSMFGASKMPVWPNMTYRLPPHVLGYSTAGGNEILAQKVMCKFYDGSNVLISSSDIIINSYEITTPSNAASCEIVVDYKVTKKNSNPVYAVTYLSLAEDKTGQSSSGLKWPKYIVSGGARMVERFTVKVATALTLTSSLTGASSPYSGLLTYGSGGAKITAAVGGRLLTTPTPHRGIAGSRIIGRIGSNYTECDTYDLASDTIIKGSTVNAPFSTNATITEVGTLQMAFGGALRFKIVEETDFYLTGPDPSATTLAQIQPTTQALTWFRFYNALNNGDATVTLDETDVKQWSGPIYHRTKTTLSLEGQA